MWNPSQAEVDEGLLDCYDEDDDEGCEVCAEHVVPPFGREHEPSAMCWCGPECDGDDATLWFHKVFH